MPHMQPVHVHMRAGRKAHEKFYTRETVYRFRNILHTCEPAKQFPLSESIGSFPSLRLFRSHEGKSQDLGSKVSDQLCHYPLQKTATLLYCKLSFSGYMSVYGTNRL